MSHANCLICQRIELIKQETNPWFVMELETGYVVIGDFQTYTGYTVFLSKEHKSELHELDPLTRQKFLQEMSLVAEAVYRAFEPDKLNYELLGNTDEHLHWHLFPRRKTDEKAHTAIWAVEKAQRNRRPSESELQELKTCLKQELDNLT